MTNTEKINEAARLLREVFPAPIRPELKLAAISTEVSLFFVGSNSQATEVLRSVGVKNRAKDIYDDGAWHTLTGSSDGIIFKAYADGIPATCHKEIFIEKIPKTQTVDTGEFVEVERVRIVCTSEQTNQTEAK